MGQKLKGLLSEMEQVSLPEYPMRRMHFFLLPPSTFCSLDEFKGIAIRLFPLRIEFKLVLSGGLRPCACVCERDSAVFLFDATKRDA